MLCRRSANDPNCLALRKTVEVRYGTAWLTWTGRDRTYWDVALSVASLRATADGMVWRTGALPNCVFDNRIGRGTWRSLVAHSLWERGVAGSNPVVPTSYYGPGLLLQWWVGAWLRCRFCPAGYGCPRQIRAKKFAHFGISIVIGVGCSGIVGQPFGGCMGRIWRDVGDGPVWFSYMVGGPGGWSPGLECDRTGPAERRGRSLSSMAGVRCRGYRRFGCVVCRCLVGR